MKTITSPSTLLLWQGKVVEVVGIAEGKMIIMNVLEDRQKDKCPHCGEPIPTEVSALEHSPHFQESAEAIPEKRLLKLK
jgi:hypothetical protein